MHDNEIETKENGLRNLTEDINYPLKAFHLAIAIILFTVKL